MEYEPLVKEGFVIVGPGGQRYECTAIKPYVRTDGAASWTATWVSPCRVCGVEFHQELSARRIDATRLTRTCVEHHRQARAA